MSHFTVLTAVALPGQLDAALGQMPDRQPINKIVSTLIQSCSGDTAEFDAQKHRPIDDQVRFECLVADLVDNQLAPYCEETNDPRYLEFIDCTEECRRTYENMGETYVRMLDGRWLFEYDSEFTRNYELYDGKICKRSFGPMHHRKRTKKARRMAVRYVPFKKRFQTFDEFATEYEGYRRDPATGAYGYYSNPNARWDWYQIGGRWPERFLVKEGCQTAIYGNASYLLKDSPGSSAPEGYCWVAGAMKKDIAWDAMKELWIQTESAQFRNLETWYCSGKVPEEEFPLTITELGIASWDTLAYAKGETFAEYLQRKGLSEEYHYPISTFACLDENGWSEMGEMGWFGISCNNKEEYIWSQMVEKFITDLPDDTVLVSVDCHI